MIVLIHSSKTMRQRDNTTPRQNPLFASDAIAIQQALAEYSVPQIQTLMHISKPLAIKTVETIRSWLAEKYHASPTIDSFIGDIYSGLRSDDFNEDDREYANSHLRILSGRKAAFILQSPESFGGGAQ